MYKTILVPLGGGDTDLVVLDAALAVARQFKAHIDCFHGWMHAGEAAGASHHIPFLVGPALTDALGFLESRGRHRAASAREHFSAFCDCYDIVGPGGSSAVEGVTASMQVGPGKVLEQLVFLARHHDLVVLARPTGKDDGLPTDLLSKLLLEGGQPLLIVPSRGPVRSLDHPLLCWKDTVETARAISQAMPVLCQARQVTLVAVDEGHGVPAASIDAVMRRLLQQGVRVEEMRETAGSKRTMDVLASVAEQRNANVLVMGARSRSVIKELLFGSCTEDALVDGAIPVLMGI